MKHKRFGTGLGRKVLACLVSAAMVVAFAPAVAWGTDPIDPGKLAEMLGNGNPDSIEHDPGWSDGTDSGSNDWYDPTPTPTLSKVGDTLPNTSMPSGTATTSSGTNIPLTGSIKLISDVPGVDDKGNPTAGSVCLFELDFSYNFSNPSESTITVTIPSTVKVGGKSYGVTSLGAVSTDPSAAESAMFLKVFQGQLAQTLEALNIPLTVTKIEQEAFTNCTKLQQIKMLVNKMLDIRRNAFAGLPNLSSVEAVASPQQSAASDEPQTVSVTLGAGAFAKAYALTMFAIKAAAGSNGIADVEMTIGDQTFEGCKSLFSAEFQATIQSIGATVAKGVTGLPASTFKGCSKLSKVTLGSSLGVIGSQALAGCAKLKSLTLPKSVKSIGSKALAGCGKLTKLTKLTVTSTQLTKKGVAGALKGSSVATVYVPKSKLKAYSKLFVKSVCGKKVACEKIA